MKMFNNGCVWGLWIVYTIHNIDCMYLLLWHIFDCVLFRFVNALVALWRILPVGLLNVCVAILLVYFGCDVFSRLYAV